MRTSGSTTRALSLTALRRSFPHGLHGTSSTLFCFANGNTNGDRHTHANQIVCSKLPTGGVGSPGRAKRSTSVNVPKSAKSFKSLVGRDLILWIHVEVRVLFSLAANRRFCTVADFARLGTFAAPPDTRAFQLQHNNSCGCW